MTEDMATTKARHDQITPTNLQGNGEDLYPSSLMSVIIAPPESVIRKLGLAARLFWSRAQNKSLRAKVASIDLANNALHDKVSQLEDAYEARLNDRDVLQAIGVHYQEDGSWRFNFKTILHNMSKEDRVEVIEEMSDIEL